MREAGAREASKVAKVTLLFWAIKIVATTLGETGGDLLSMTFNLGYAQSSIILIGAFFALFALQMARRSFNPALYWGVILATSSAGTTMSDFMDRTLHFGYVMGSLLLASLVAASLAAWWAVERSLSVSDIRTRRSELFYWMTILFSNTLGTAFGDFLADSSGLGFLGGWALVSAAIAVLALLYAFSKVDRVLLFWLAFVLTRPFGATLGDLLTKGHDKGGLGFGTIGSSAVLAVALALLVAIPMLSKPKTARAAA